MDVIEEIEKYFRELCENDPEIKSINEKLRQGKAVHMDISVYSRRLGALARKAIEDNFPDYELHSEKYEEFAEEIVGKMLRQNYDDVFEKDAAVQTMLDMKSGIGLRPVKADFPTERVKTVIAAAKAADVIDQAVRRIGAPVENITESFHMDFVKENAKFRSKAGFETYIVRTDGAGCCKWCHDLAGKYRYPDQAPKDVFRRHDNCTCDVSYVCEKGRQNVHNKQWTTAKLAQQKQEREQRIEYAKSLPKPKRFTKEEARQMELEAKMNSLKRRMFE